MFISSFHIKVTQIAQRDPVRFLKSRFLMQMESLEKLIKERKNIMRLATFETKHLALSLWLVVRAGVLGKW